MQSLVKQQFPVTDMSCAACAVSVESTLQGQPGVASAAVNYATQTVQVEYDPTQITPDAMNRAVQSMGYGLVVDIPEKAAETAAAIRSEHYEALKRKVMWAVALGIPLALLGMFGMRLPYVEYVLWALSTPLVWWFGRSFFSNAWKQAQHGAANMDTLVALSTGTAYIFSVFNLFFQDFWHARGLHAHVWFEAAGIVVVFILLGKLLEERAKAGTSAAISGLMNLQPKLVSIIESDGRIVETMLASVLSGQKLLVKPGDKVPVDGILFSGSSYVDESMFTGEPIPVLKEKGAQVLAGSLNQKGSFQMTAQKVGADTLLAQIIRTVQEAQGSKAPVQRLADRIAGIFVPVVMGIALLAFCAWWWLGGPNGFVQGLHAFVTVLVIACPCALGLATPTAVMVGIGKAAEHGILIKDAESLEKAQRIQAVVLDKTGTITQGKPQVTALQWADKTDISIWQSAWYALEKNSAHPLAEALTEWLESGARPIHLVDVENLPGMGISAVYQEEKIWAGNKTLLLQNDISLPEALEKLADQWAAEASTPVWFAAGKQALAVAAITDPVKQGAAAAIQTMKNNGLEVFLLTGDHIATATAVAEAVGIQQFQAGMLPADKELFIKQLQQSGKVVAMVGDGINDTQAMAHADVSIAMGKGSDIAMDVAQMTLIGGDLNKIPEAIRLSKRTVATIRQNLFWAFIYNVIGIPLAAGILYPVNGFLLDPMIAGAAMALSSVSVVLNSLRLKTA
ncbi:MAG: heavy metal translocating P-type ATPase [Bacteroidetes bacterium]|nr:heavy metal translocating P-type ATPase [Bacteroidota bacterium]